MPFIVGHLLTAGAAAVGAADAAVVVAASRAFCAGLLGGC